MLMLDEPTNDLDLLTLRVLEEALLSYDGAAIVVTHDRAFLDRVCTAVLVFEGEGRITRYASRVQAESAQAAARAESEKRASAAKDAAQQTAPAPSPRARPAKLSYKERRELQALPGEIEAIETEQAALTEKLSDPATYRGGGDVSALTARLAEIESSLEALYARWELLESRE